MVRLFGILGFWFSYAIVYLSPYTLLYYQIRLLNFGGPYFLLLSLVPTSKSTWTDLTLLFDVLCRSEKKLNKFKTMHLDIIFDVLCGSEKKLKGLLVYLLIAKLGGNVLNILIQIVCLHIIFYLLKL